MCRKVHFASFANFFASTSANMCESRKFLLKVTTLAYLPAAGSFAREPRM